MKEQMAMNLRYPIKIGTLEEVKVLNFRRIKGKDIRGLEFGDLNQDKILELAEKLTNQTTSFFDEMDAVDIIRLVEIVGNLFADSQKTGS